MRQVSYHVKTWGPGYSFVTKDEGRALAQVGRETDRLFVKVAPYCYMPYADWKREQGGA